MERLGIRPVIKKTKSLECSIPQLKAIKKRPFRCSKSVRNTIQKKL